MTSFHIQPDAVQSVAPVFSTSTYGRWWNGNYLPTLFRVWGNWRLGAVCVPNMWCNRLTTYDTIRYDETDGTPKVWPARHGEAMVGPFEFGIVHTRDCDYSVREKATAVWEGGLMLWLVSLLYIGNDRFHFCCISLTTTMVARLYYSVMVCTGLLTRTFGGHVVCWCLGLPHHLIAK